MKFRPTTTATVVEDLRTFATALDDPDLPDGLGAEIAHWLNQKLDKLVRCDFFGTEGQHDPRGDHRE